MTFQPFQNLYQYLKKGEHQRLFEALDTISGYLQDIIAALITSELTWVPLTLSGTWASSAATNYIPAGAVNSDGRVVLTGILKTTNYPGSGSQILLLNSTCRPQKACSVGIHVFDNNTGQFFGGALSIATTGVVTLAAAPTAGHTVFAYLEGLSFRITN